jgi:hypothetical protein
VHSGLPAPALLFLRPGKTAAQGFCFLGPFQVDLLYFPALFIAQPQLFVEHFRLPAG